MARVEGFEPPVAALETAGLRIKLHDSDDRGGVSMEELSEIFKNSRAQLISRRLQRIFDIAARGVQF